MRKFPYDSDGAGNTLLREEKLRGGKIPFSTFWK